MLVAPATAAAQWQKSTDWLLVCTAYLENIYGADSPVCDEVHQVGGIKLTLDEGSLWLERLNFASPALSANLDLAPHVEDQTEAWQNVQLASQRDPRCEERYCAWLVFGLGSHGAYMRVDSSLVLDPFNMIENGIDPGYDEGFGFAEVHELFHAVQFGYPLIGDWDEIDWIDWFIEGSAQHVARMWGALQGMTTSGAVWRRTYDQSLHLPPTEDEDAPAYDAWAYGSELFFDFLGEYLGSPDRVAYLAAVLERIDSDETGPLEALDDVLDSQTGKGLYDAFPEFVRTRLDRPCYFSHLGTWRDGGCRETGDNEHRFELPFPDTIVREHAAADLAANGYLVRMEIPEGETGRLVIRVPPDRDDDNLHLIVGDERRDDAGISGHRNEFTASLPAGEHEYLVRLVNVPEGVGSVDASAGLDFGGDDAAPIEFILGRAACWWNASVSGLPGAVTGADARWGTVRYSDSSWPPLEMHAIVQDGDPQPEAPWLVIQLTNRGEIRYSEIAEFLEIKLAIPGIRPGETGSFRRVWGTLNAGTGSYDGTAEYLRRNVVGLDEGTGMGPLLTTDVSITTHDEELVAGSFDARFLDLSRVPRDERTPPGLGVHRFPEAEIRLRGEFSILLGSECATTTGVRRMAMPESTSSPDEQGPGQGQSSGGQNTGDQQSSSESPTDDPTGIDGPPPPPDPRPELPGATPPIRDASPTRGEQPSASDDARLQRARPDREPAADSPAGRRDQADLLPPVTSFSLEASGAVDTTFVVRPGDLVLNGGCSGQNRLSLGFSSGLPDAPDYFSFAFDTSGSIDGTGDFTVDEIRWDNGTDSHEIPGGGAVRVPNRFMGPGRLTIAQFDQGIGQRHLTGTIEGRLRQPRGGSVVEVVADFAVNVPCGALR